MRTILCRSTRQINQLLDPSTHCMRRNCSVCLSLCVCSLHCDRVLRLTLGWRIHLNIQWTLVVQRLLFLIHQRICQITCSSKKTMCRRRFSLIVLLEDLLCRIRVDIRSMMTASAFRLRLMFRWFQWTNLDIWREFHRGGRCIWRSILQWDVEVGNQWRREPYSSPMK